MSSMNPTIAGQVLGVSTNASCEIKPANDQPTREEMLEKLKADAAALLRRLESASADIDLGNR
ncbi:hypothetical protein SAMN05877838_3604 [Hoeflea halophila]|uniref:Uncharacterized protein n=1 Tax=Hoeflea halophila TaxID=714899 RepID=A0A286IEX7_9HYPH|nr:hypothetical protein [Hoeflea halophila]SOE18668.1 hypothetical protein SAMN05877838_3604 [Hoeflea halophila]